MNQTSYASMAKFHNIIKKSTEKYKYHSKPYLLKMKYDKICMSIHI